MIGRRFLLFLLSVLGGLATLADAASLLKATVNELAPRTRRAAPLWVEVVLSSRSTAIREGALEFTMTEWGEVIYRYQTHDLVLNSGDQHFRFMLPAATAAGGNSTRTVQLRFIEKGASTMLGEFPLSISPRNGDVHVIAVIRPSFGLSGADTLPLWQALRLERFAPDTGPEIDTFPMFFDPSDLPADPLGFFPFDLVLIEPGTFGKMRERARAALMQWVNAGGSLCIVADHGLEAEDLASINQLGSVDPRWRPLATNNSSRVEIPGGLALARVNFGRMVVTSELPPQNVEDISPIWRKATIFLWRLTSAQAEQIEQNGRWEIVQERNPIDSTLPKDQQKKLQEERSRRYRIESNWRRFDTPIWEVFPDSVRVVPLWVLATVIGAFLLLVGPVDWFVLGAFRCHRLTWLLFPFIAILVTAGTVLLVQRFMGSARRASAVIISDIGATGRVVRETRIELVLPAAQSIATTSMKGALCLPLRSSSQYGGGRATDWEELVFRGQYPTHFDYIRPQRQWSPEISRVTSIADAPDTSGIKWDVFTLDFLSKHKAAFQPIQPVALSKRVAAAARDFDLTVAEAVRSSRKHDTAISLFTKWGTRDVGMSPTSAVWRRAITTSLPIRNRALFTHVSPSGFPQNDDLRVLEPEDSSRTVIFAAQREGDTIHVWRRLYLHK